MDQHNTTLFGLTIDPNSKVHLSEAARWARFLAIVGFVLCGLIVIFGVFFGSYIGLMMPGNEFEDSGLTSSAFGAFMAVYCIMGALLYFFPCLFLFRFANHMRASLVSNDQETLNKSFQNLKIMLRYLGILTIIVLAFYAIGLVIFLISLSATSM